MNYAATEPIKVAPPGDGAHDDRRASGEAKRHHNQHESGAADVTGDYR